MVFMCCLKEFQDIAFACCKAVAALHKKNLVHRDMRIANVVGRCVLLAHNNSALHSACFVLDHGSLFLFIAVGAY